MKKLNYLIVLILALTITTTSCKKDVSFEGNSFNFKNKTKRLVGTYIDEYDNTWTFEEDGDFIQNFNVNIEYHGWRWSENNDDDYDLEIKRWWKDNPTNPWVATYDIYSITKDEIVFMAGSGDTWTITKIE